MATQDHNERPELADPPKEEEMKCEHTLGEMETACYCDSLCPICLSEEVKRLREGIEEYLEIDPSCHCKICEKLRKLVESK